MRTKFIYAVPSLVLALLAIGLAVYGLMQTPAPVSQTSPAQQSEVQATQPVKEDAVPMYRYLVAVVDLDAGARLEPEHVQEFELPVELANSIPSEDAPFGDTLIRPLRAGMLLSQDLISGGTPLQLTLQDGVRAMAFELTSLSSIGGLIQPGDHVDIYGTFRGAGGTEAGTARLIQNVEVLAVRGAMEQGSDSSDDSQRRNQTMVLSVPQKDVARLVLAAAEARLNFVASKPEETVAEGSDAAQAPRADDQQVTLMADIRPSARAKPAPAPQPRQAPARNPGQEVKIYEGSGSRSVYVR
ncbi:Flp pilus assembly protein CpaB [Marinobacter sp.]|uniref:Flp pilus assembly protein CpaB n=1 Tax=Marinobacter sp. TaxID=50741 RepID=UPI001A00905C|nr:Flp pilus assembly protein CpaB [Marinobacter sp.]MBE0487153.1 Flp pilus assembly protein CpaB [Marinobacter sp.]